MTSDLADARFLVAAALLLLLAVMLIVSHRRVRALRHDLAAVNGRIAAQDEELGRWAATVAQRVGEVDDRKEPVSPHEWRHTDLSGTSFGQHLRIAEEGFSHVLGEAHSQAEQATQSMLLAVARKLQGLANSQQLKITEMTRRHDDPAFIQDLMDVDHTNAQILRRAAGMAVACRAWPGRQHNATPLYDVVRGAVGRILDYKRVQITRLEDHRAVEGRAVEGLVVALAELLENATRYSNPNTAVQVHVQLTHNGLAIVIEDAGIGLNASERNRLSGLLTQETLDITHLGNPPRFGLVVCGLLAKRYGFTVSVDSASPFGGVRAVVNLPSALLTESAPVPAPPVAVAAPAAARVPAQGARQTPAQDPGAPAAPAGSAAPAAPEAGAGQGDAPRSTTVSGLPKRTRHTPSATGQAGARPVPPLSSASHHPASPARSPEESAAPFGGFLRGAKAARRSSQTQEPKGPAHS
ncbi:ATP-binding protein [Streptomyces sp. ACA25]|uniref:ATP-binding protein n=1 Tax=Streptomyces sp. ACA25 TaxID=3022596 RepID=UPI0023079737|nr:ATP-binding protein [Streptomyces sp. ACA25]MDB1086583.1 ATP-binding protein [Streptomyces sp. ACA25]